MLPSQDHETLSSSPTNATSVAPHTQDQSFSYVKRPCAKSKYWDKYKEILINNVYQRFIICNNKSIECVRKIHLKNNKVDDLI